MGNPVDLYHLARFAGRHPLAKKRKIRTFMRFVRWQVAAYVLGQPAVMPYVGGQRLIISKKMRGAAANYYLWLPEIEEVALVLHYLRPNDLLGDIGANIGPLTVAGAGVARARVIAMEPVPATYAALQDNIAVNHLQGLVQTHAAGASDTPSTLTFSTDSGCSDRIVQDGEGHSVPVKPLDEIFTETPDVLVVDVEGFEPAVVKGASRLLADQKLKIVILETVGLAASYGLDDNLMHATMLEYGFQTFRYDYEQRTLKATEGIDRFNTIYVRDVPHVEQRLRQAAGFSVDGCVI